LEEDLEFWASAGIGRVELSLRKVEAAGTERAVALVRGAGLRVDSVIEAGHFLLADPATWPAERDRLGRAVELAAATGARSVVLLPGAPGRLEWEDAAGALAEALGPVAAAARAAGVALALENTSSLRIDLSFVHTLRDALDLAGRLDIGLCMEIQSCWAERGLAATVADAVSAGRLVLVQVSDAVAGSLTTPDRVVPGDGDVPLARVLGDVLRAGYEGSFDLELVGPRIEAEGYAAAISRGLAFLGRLLDELAAPSS
jgi:sugar phosphate isomerase/epimerase